MSDPTTLRHHRVVLASSNPVKVAATESGFKRVFSQHRIEVVSVSVPSGVPSQPLSDTETLRGAEQRAAASQLADPDGHYWVGIEGGVDETVDGMVALAWVVVRSGTDCGRSRTGSFLLPPEIAGLIREGIELGKADDIVFGRVNSKQGEGAVGILTNGLIDRTQFYESSVVFALIPFLNPGLYGRSR